MPDELAAIQKDIHEIKTAVAVLKERSDHTIDHCPYRVQISRNENGIKDCRKDILEAIACAKQAMAVAQDNRVKIAQLVGSGVAGGGLVALVQALVAFAK